MITCDLTSHRWSTSRSRDQSNRHSRLLPRFSLRRHGSNSGSAGKRGDGDRVKLVESEGGEGGDEVVGERDVMSEAEIENVKVRETRREGGREGGRWEERERRERDGGREGERERERREELREREREREIEREREREREGGGGGGGGRGREEGWWRERRKMRGREIGKKEEEMKEGKDLRAITMIII